MTLKNDTKAKIPDTVLELIYEAASDEAKWTDALYELARWVGASGAMYCLLDSRAAQPQVKALYSSGFSAAANTAYADKHCLVDPHMPLAGGTPTQTWFFSQDHFDRQFITRNAFFQEVMNPLGIRWVAGSRVWASEQSVACLAFQKPLDSACFEDIDRSRLAAVTAHIGRATRIHDRLRTCALVAASGIEATGNLSFGLALLDAQARVMYSNAVADRLFGQKSVFKSTLAHRIALANAGCQAEFNAAITAAAQLDSSALRILDRDGKPVIHMVVLPMRPLLDGTEPGSVRLRCSR